MYHLYSDPVSQAQKHKKHQYYKSMLDQQLKYKQTQQISKLVSYSGQPNAQTPSYDKKQEYSSAGSQNHRYDLYRNQNQSKTEQYIHTCERIINNLKQINNRHNSLEPSKQIHQNPQKQNLRESSSIEPIHKTFNRQKGYFSNVSYLYDARQAQERAKVHNKSRNYRTLENQSSCQQKVTSRVRKHAKLTPLKKYNHPQGSNRKSQAQKDESSHPEGIRKKNNLSKSRVRDRRNTLAKGQQGKEQQLMRIKSDLVDCLLELNQYLEDKQCIKKELEDKPYKKEQSQRQQMDAQIQVGQATNQEMETLKRQKQLTQQKLNAILKLRKIHEKSKYMAERVSLQRSLVAAKLPKQQSKVQIQCKLSSYRQGISQRPSFDDSPQPQPITIKEQEIRQSTINKQLLPQQTEGLIRAVLSHLQKNEEQNQDLASCLKELSKYLTNQDKTAYKNKQNQNISSPKRAISSLDYPEQATIGDESRHEESAHLNSRTETLDPQKAQKQIDKSTHNKFQEAIIRRLKKARIRGSLLSEKITHHNNLRKLTGDLTTEIEHSSPVQA